MENTYARMRQRARQIVARFPSPDFYQDHLLAKEMSCQFFETNPVVSELHTFVAGHLEEDFGHGLEHAVKVAIDAGALMIIENQLAGNSGQTVHRRVTLVQCAGLLHDIKRKQKDHAVQGAAYARKVLKIYQLFPDEIKDVCRAILNHEAFKSTVKIETFGGALVSDCLYDADKFRWGPDNFTDTLWAMAKFYNIPVAQFVEFYPQGIEKIDKIRTTFRTATGKKYGPQFIDLGIAIGAELFEVINTEFAHLL